MVKCYKYRLYPNKEQQRLIDLHIDAMKSIYNQMLYDIKQDYLTNFKETKKLKKIVVSEYTNKLENEHFWEAGVAKQCVGLLKYYDLSKSIDGYVKSNYSKFLEGKLLFDNKNNKTLDDDNPDKELNVPSFKKKNDSYSFSMQNIKNTIRINYINKKVRIPRIGEVSFVEHTPCLGEIKEIRVSKTKTNKYFISITTDYEEKNDAKINLNTKKVVGIDLGLRTLMTLSNGIKVENPKFKTIDKRLQYYKEIENIENKKIKARREELINNNPKLTNYDIDKIIHNEFQTYKRRKIREKINLMEEKDRNKKIDYIRKTICEVLKDYDVIVIENLYVNQMYVKYSGIPKKEQKNINKAYADSSLAMIKQFIADYAYRTGKILKYAKQYYPSSQLCNCCGRKYPEAKKIENREWICPNCGKFHDRDLNAAINLANLYINNKNEWLIDKPTDEKKKKKTQ